MRKNPLSRTKLALVAVFLLARAAFAAGNDNHPVATPRHVDVVIALDTSSSMDGLIDSARQKLWDVVNLLGQAKPQPTLRVGLISYGNTHYDAKAGWVRKESDLTTDLDSIYSKLFALRTMGGTEYVARAVRDATNTMQWEQDPRALKILFVAGNEPANQDPVFSVESVVQEAREKGIFVNTIYCGSTSNGEAIGWRNVANLGSGRFAAIDQDHTVAIATPMDGELARLSGELNKTYVAYGHHGRARAENQAAQDANAQSQGLGVAASRAQAKSSAVYSNDDWDLVDAEKKGKKDVKEMAADELPEPMRAMKPAEREAFVAAKAQERAALQKKIAETNGKREQFLRAERAKRPKAGHPAALDDAMTDALKSEAQSAGFAF